MEILLDYFLISILLTYLLIYILYPKPKVVLKYPSIDNEISDLYVDDNKSCYRYHRSEIKCPFINK